MTLQQKLAEIQAQQAKRPVHRLRPRCKGCVLATWCGAEPDRRGVRTEGVNVFGTAATCRKCLAEEAKATAAN